MTAKDIESIVGEKRTLGAVVELSSEIFIPGEVKRNTIPSGTWFGIGSMSNLTRGRESEITEILKFSGKVSITENILSAKWMKLIVNAMTMGPRSLVGLKAMEAMELEGMRDLALKCGEEALNVGQKLGYTVEPIFGLKREDIEGSNRLLETLLDKIVKDVGPHAKDAVLHDHLKGRYSEVDLINGLVADEGLRLKVHCPANKLVADLTNRIKNGELKPNPDNMKYLKV
jgi:2-dehydropantoate 2-reductase